MSSIRPWQMKNISVDVQPKRKAMRERVKNNLGMLFLRMQMEGITVPYTRGDVGMVEVFLETRQDFAKVVESIQKERESWHELELAFAVFNLVELKLLEFADTLPEKDE